MSIFSKIQVKKPKFSTFNLSCQRKMSLQMGLLVPIHVQEVLPSDKFTMSTSQLLRFAPMIAPVMHEVNVYVHHWFVPNRILWKHWSEFITGGENGLDASLLPVVVNLEVEKGSLADYLGLPVTANDGLITEPISLLPFLAYQMIYNENYRDQNLIESLKDMLESVEDGEIDYQTLLQDGDLNYPDNIPSDSLLQLFVLRRRAWEHDYFTSCLPFAQKGNPVRIPLSPSLPVTWNDNVPDQVRSLQGENGQLTLTGADDVSVTPSGIIPNGRAISIDNSANLSVDTQANATTINDWRRAIRLQEWLEKNARAGARLVESIEVHFGVKSPDSRLQRPEFLGGGKSPVMVSEVLQTSETQDTPQANMAGHGINLGSNASFSRFFQEHGYIISIMSVMPRTAYQQGIPRHFSKLDKFDYFWRDFQHIGEQPVYNKELYYAGGYEGVDGDSTPNGVFGYIPRYSEYRFNSNTVHGDMKAELDYWHMGRIFVDSAGNNPPEEAIDGHVVEPKLNKDFIECNPTRRIFAVEDLYEDILYCQIFHNITARRPMSYFGSPML